MAPWQPKRAFVGGTLTTLPFALASGVLFGIGGDAAAIGFYVLLAGSLVTGVITAWHLHAIYAILLTVSLSSIGLVLVLGIFGGLHGIAGMLHVAPLLFIASVPGAIIGLFTRRVVREAQREREAASGERIQ